MEASAGLLKKAKTALRIKSNNEDIEDEIKDLIESCIADLQLAGVNTIDEKDPLIISAVKQYCKGYFGSSDKADHPRLSAPDRSARRTRLFEPGGRQRAGIGSRSPRGPDCERGDRYGPAYPL